MTTGIAFRSVAVLALACIMILAILAETTMAKDDKISAYRDLVLTGIENHIKAVGSIVDGDVKFMHHVPDHAVAIAGATRALFEIYPEKAPKAGNGAGAPQQRQPSPFVAAATQFNMQASGLVQAAATGDSNAITAQYKAVKKAYETFLREAQTPSKEEDVSKEDDK